MERIAVQSTDLAIVGYDPQTLVLEITFRRGGVYRYTGVPGQVHRELLAAPSQGLYFRDHIKEKFESVKIA